MKCPSQECKLIYFRPFRQSGNTSPRVEPSTRGAGQRERPSKSGPVGPHTPGVPSISPKYGSQANRPPTGSDWDARSDTKRIRKPSQTVERWSRHSSKDEDEWSPVSKRKTLKDEKEDWEPISDEDIEYRGRRASSQKADKHKIKSRKGNSAETIVKPKNKYERPKPQSSQSSYLSQERDNPQVSQSDDELEEDGPDPEDLMQLIPYESELEDFDFADSPEAKNDKSKEEVSKQQDTIVKPPEPGEPDENTLNKSDEHPPAMPDNTSSEVSNALKQTSESEGEVKDEQPHSSKLPELPRAGKSPTDIQEPEEETELPRPGVSPTAGLAQSPADIPVRQRSRPPTPLGEPMSSPESGEVGDDESPHESDDKMFRSPSLEAGGNHDDVNEDDMRPESPTEAGEITSSSSPPSHHSRTGRGSSLYRSPTSGSTSRDSRKTPLIPSAADRDVRQGQSDRHSSVMPMTRASRKRSEEESLPVAKRLRR